MISKVDYKLQKPHVFIKREGVHKILGTKVRGKSNSVIMNTRGPSKNVRYNRDSL